MMRRALAGLFAVFCLLYQAEWPVWAALSVPASSMMECPCRGTDDCCCRGSQTQADASGGESHGLCHLPQQQPPAQAASCVLQADDCGGSLPASASGMHREPVSIAGCVTAIAAPSRPHTPAAMRITSTAFLDLPFVPPEKSPA